MVTFEVNDMSCGHCVSSITKAVRGVDAHAKVDVDLGRHLVHVDPFSASADALSTAIADAGYTPMRISSNGPVVNSTRSSGGCCG